MLATNQVNNIGEFAINLNSSPNFKSFLSAGIVLREPYNMTCENKNLYIISNDEIKEGDYYYRQGLKCIDQCSNEEHGEVLSKDKYCKKVIASTDSSLGLPMIQESFINHYVESYNKGEVITSVQIEFEWEPLFVPIPDYKVTDNFINIKSVKDTFSREEVIALLYEALTADGPGAYSMGWDDNDAKEWIENNL